MNKQPNIILLVLDTLRSDFTVDPDKGIPLLKSIKDNSEEWNIFNNCVSPASWTIPAHASLFSGVYPSRNGVIEGTDGSIPDYSFLYDHYQGDTLPAYMKGAGYKTYSFCQNGLVGKDTSFMRGVDLQIYSENEFQATYDRMHKSLNVIYDNWGGDSARKTLKKSFQNHNTLSLLKEYYNLKSTTIKLKNLNMAKKGGREVIKNLQNIKIEEPFFMFTNLMETHDPHDEFSLGIGWQDTVFGNNAGYAKKVNGLKESYSSAVDEVDFFLSNLFSLLKKLKVYEDTMIIITSDHGQSLFDDGYFGHCNFLYDSIIRVPLLIKLPQGRRLDIQQGYQSLTGIFDFIKTGIESNNFYDNISKELVFSECNGFYDPIVKKYRNTVNFRDIYEKYNIPTKAIFKDGYKLTFDFKNHKITELKKGKIKVDPNEIPKICDSLLEDLSIFANVDF